MISLDANATTPLDPRVLAAMLPWLEREHGNPSSIHAAGRATRAALDSARDRAAAVLGVKSHEIIFTGGGTESDNLAILGLARTNAARGRHLITCATEHHAVLHAFDWLEKHEGFRVTRLPVDARGHLDLQQLADALTPETTLVSIMTANNETGVIHPTAEISAICRARGVLLHTDAIQSFGKEPLAPRDFDAVSLAGHKFFGPKGVGLLYLAGGISLAPTQYGGAQENQRRPGTENTPAIVGMATAMEFAVENLDEKRAATAALRDQLWLGISTVAPEAVRNGDPARCLANTLNVTFPGCDAESLLMALDLAGVHASSGSACMVGSVLPSHVLVAMGASEDAARCTVRFSLGRAHTPAEMDAVAAALPGILTRVRE